MPPHMPSTPRPRSSAADKASVFMPCGSPLLWRGKGEPPAPRKTRWRYNPGVGVALWAARPISVLANFLELRTYEVQLRRICLPRTRVNRPSSVHLTSLDGIMLVVERLAPLGLKGSE